MEFDGNHGVTENSKEFLAFLQSEASEGQLTETGEFTLDTVRARAKLGEFALPEPGLWVVKLVQAAVAAGAESINFTFARRKVEVVFDNAGAWEALEILQSIVSATVPKGRARMHLQTGLLAAASGTNDSVTWSCGEHTVVVSDKETLRKVNPSPEQVKIVAVRQNKPTQKPSFWTSPVRYLFKQTAHEYKAIIERCRCSPIPISVDGYEISRHYGVPSHALPQAPKYNSDANEGRRLLLAIKPLNCFSDRSPLEYPLPETVVPAEPKDWEEWETFTPTGLPALNPTNAVLAFFSVLQRESRITYTLDGAVVCYQKFENESPWCDEPFLERFVSALQTAKERFVFDLYLETQPDLLDLTHFQVKESSPTEHIRKLVPEIIKLLQDIRQHCDRPWKFHSGKLNKPKVKNASLSDILVSGFVAPFVPHLLVVGGVYLLTSPIVNATKPYFNKRRSAKLKRVLDQCLRQLGELSDV